MQQLVKDQSESSGMQIPGYSGEHAQHVLKAILKGIGIEPGLAMKSAAKAGVHQFACTDTSNIGTSQPRCSPQLVCMQLMTSEPP